MKPNVLLEIKTFLNKYIFKTTIRQYENIQFQLEVVPKKLYSCLSEEGIRSHKQEVIIKKLGLKVQDIESVREVGKEYVKILIASNLIQEYRVNFSLETLCTREVMICNAVSDPTPAGFCSRPLCVVPDRLCKIAYENGIFATKLSDYLRSTKKELSSKWLKKE